MSEVGKAGIAKMPLSVSVGVASTANGKVVLLDVGGEECVFTESQADAVAAGLVQMAEAIRAEFRSSLS